jgi:hypothetical protein
VVEVEVEVVVHRLQLETEVFTEAELQVVEHLQLLTEI